MAGEVTKSIAMGRDNSRQLSQLAELQQSLTDLKEHARAGTGTEAGMEIERVDETALTRLLDEKLAGMQGRLQSSLAESIRAVMSESQLQLQGSDPSQSEKLDALVSMVNLTSLYFTLLYFTLTCLVLSLIFSCLLSSSLVFL